MDFNIPKGATHYDPVGDLYFKVDHIYFDGTACIWLDGKWMTTEWSSAFEATLEVLE